jgi:hypothetical protein
MKKILSVNNDLDKMSLLKIWLQQKHYGVEFTGKRKSVPELVSKTRRIFYH